MKRLRIPTDRKAKYYVIHVSGPPEACVLLSQRKGKSGISYSKKIFNLPEKTFKYLGDGDNLEELGKSERDADMAELVRHSIAWYQWKYLCDVMKPELSKTA